MSLLDDVSIVVTPNGYKAGELYAVVPVPTEGAELLTNGDFASDLTGWTGYGTTSATGGVATIGASANSGIYQGILTEGVRYTVTVNVTSYDGVGNARFVNDNGAYLYNITETGIQTFTFVHDIASSNLIIRGESNALFSLSSVSVKEYTAADMDVTRATAATRVDEDGLVNYAEIIGSEEVTCGDFECASPLTDWTVSGLVTIASGVATFLDDGTNTNSSIAQSVLTTNKTYKLVFEITRYVAGRIQILSGGGTYYVDISGGEGVYTTIIQSVGSTTFTIKRNGVYSGFDFDIDNVSVKEVIRDNVPRIDYTGGGCPHILAEPQRTNLLTYSEDFSNAIWQKQTGIVSTYNTTETLSPDGTYNATKFIGTGSTGVFKSSVSVSGNITRSVYLKSVSGTTTAVFKDPNATGGATPVNLTITNDWQRFELTGDNGTAFQGLWIDDITSDGLYMWGAQLEEGSYATSYIPTSGSVVTRNQDIFTRDGIGSLIGQTEGTFFIELSKPVLEPDNYYLISLNNAASNSDDNSVVIGFENSNDFFIRVQANGADVFYSNNLDALNVNTFYKIAVSYKSGQSLVYIDGSPITPNGGSLSGTFAFTTTLDNLSFDFNGNNGLPFYGKVKQLQVYNTALTDEQLLQLTGTSGTDFYESYAEMASALTYTIQ